MKTKGKGIAEMLAKFQEILNAQLLGVINSMGLKLLSANISKSNIQSFMVVLSMKSLCLDLKVRKIKTIDLCLLIVSMMRLALKGFCECEANKMTIKMKKIFIERDKIFMASTKGLY